MDERRPHTAVEDAPRALPRQLVLIVNTLSGHGRNRMRRLNRAIVRQRLQVLETISPADLGRLRAWIDRPAEERPLFVAAGGDGTVGAVANELAHTGCLMGILPLGTSNDVARSLGIPMRIEDAVALLVEGKASTIDAGKLESPGCPHRYFVHAAALGLTITFARIATQASLRKRLGRLTYLVAAAAAFRARQPFDCRLDFVDRSVSRRLLHLSVINAPVFGGRLHFSLLGSDLDDRRLDVLAIENIALPRLALAFVLLLLRKHPRGGGIHLYHVRRFSVHVEPRFDVSMDGEISGCVPGTFVVAPEALYVVTPHTFADLDD